MLTITKSLVDFSNQIEAVQNAKLCYFTDLLQQFSTEIGLAKSPKIWNVVAKNLRQSLDKTDSLRRLCT